MFYKNFHISNTKISKSIPLKKQSVFIELLVPNKQNYLIGTACKHSSNATLQVLISILLHFLINSRQKIKEVLWQVTLN